MTDLPIAMSNGPAAVQPANPVKNGRRDTGGQAANGSFGRLLDEEKSVGAAKDFDGESGREADAAVPFMGARLRQNLAGGDLRIGLTVNGERTADEKSAEAENGSAEMAASALTLPKDPLSVASDGPSAGELFAASATHGTPAVDTKLQTTDARNAVADSMAPGEKPRKVAAGIGERGAALLSSGEIPLDAGGKAGPTAGQPVASAMPGNRASPETPPSHQPADIRIAAQERSDAGLEKSRTPRSEAIGLTKADETRDSRRFDAEGAASTKNGLPAAPASPVAVNRTIAVPPALAAASLDRAAGSLTHAIGQQLTVSQIQEFNGGRTKVLKLQLQPAHLGQLDIVLKDTNGRLSVQIQTGSADAQDVLTREKTALRTALDEANLSVETLSIEAPKDRRAAVASLTQVESTMNEAHHDARERFDGDRSNANTGENRARNPAPTFGEIDDAGPDGRGPDGRADGSGAAGLRI